MANRLAGETSPYLLQHAHNPVDWYPWGEEAFARARAEDRPILLSVGYAACHWCHVMERESFEDEATARLMNEWFVNVKVDREERPDVDQIYMAAVQAMTGHGGWPMTVFLTPDGEPFYGGTYFPPEDRHGMPSFRRILQTLAVTWRTERDKVAQTTEALRQLYARAAGGLGAAFGSGGGITGRTLERAVRAIVGRYDPVHGGLAGAPKFPATMAMEFLLTQWARTGGRRGGDPELLEMPLQTFRAMARGGIHDQVGGGFARYSVDAEWLVPHFEKMLYDNALLVRHGVHLWQATGGPAGGDAEVRRVTEATLDWLAREMTDAGGGFYATLDADSEGHEGKFYLWDEPELDALLGDDAPAVKRYWGATAGGNFEGRNLLHVAAAGPAAEEGDDPALAAAVRRARATLYAARARRVWPGRDEKILAAWNGLMLRAVAGAARAFGRPQDRALALANGAFLARTLVDGATGRVMRVHAKGVTRIPGFLEDHAAVGLGLLALWELTFDRRWLDLARRTGEACVTWFWDELAGAFFDTASDHERMVTRPREPTDNATPSGTSLACDLLLRLAELDDRADWRRLVERALDALAEAMARHAPAFGHLLGVADQAVHGAVAVALVGAADVAEVEPLAAVVGTRYVPALVLAGGVAGDASPALLADRPAVGGTATAYVCRHSTCERPATDAGTLAGQLDTAPGGRGTTGA